MKSGKSYPTQTFAQFGGGAKICTIEGKVRDIVAQKTGIGSGKQNETDRQKSDEWKHFRIGMEKSGI